MIEPPLACTVRNCERPLVRESRRLVCANGHTYDVARSGYVNLLQPQDRRSRRAGDTKAAVQARARLLAAGVGRTILAEFVRRAGSLALDESAIVVDLGSGSGDALALLSNARRITGIGIDLSPAAAELAATRFPSLTWIVANADRRLPILDRSVDLVLSFLARRNAAESARILKTTGFLLIAVPAGDDLIELRASVQGQGVERDRAHRVQAEHDALFTLVDRSTAREEQDLERDAILDLLRATYRGARAAQAERVGKLMKMKLTLALDVLLFAPR